MWARVHLPELPHDRFRFAALREIAKYAGNKNPPRIVIDLLLN
jgi:hypothetical protein